VSSKRIVIVILLLTLAVSGCGYPKMSPAAIEMARSLYTVCNQKRENFLTVAEEKISSLKSEGSLSDSEVSYLTNVITMAREGKWEKAMLASRQMMEDQVPH